MCINDHSTVFHIAQKKFGNNADLFSIYSFSMGYLQSKLDNNIITKREDQFLRHFTAWITVKFGAIPNRNWAEIIAFHCGRDVSVRELFTLYEDFLEIMPHLDRSNDNDFIKYLLGTIVEAWRGADSGDIDFFIPFSYLLGLCNAVDLLSNLSMQFEAGFVLEFFLSNHRVWQHLSAADWEKLVCPGQSQPSIRAESITDGQCALIVFMQKYIGIDVIGKMGWKYNNEVLQQGADDDYIQFRIRCQNLRLPDVSVADLDGDTFVSAHQLKIMKENLINSGKFLPA